MSAEPEQVAAAPALLPAAAAAAPPSPPRSPVESSAGRPFYTDRGALIFRRRPSLFWLLLGVALSGGSLALAALSSQPIFARTCLPLAIGIAALPFAMKMGVRVLADWDDVLCHVAVGDPAAVRAWHAGRLRLGSEAMAQATGAIFVPWALASFVLGGYFDGLSALETGALAAMIALAAFTSGVAVYYLGHLTASVWQLGRFAVRVESHPYGVMRIGRGLLRCYLVAALIWFVISISGSWKAAGDMRPVMLIGLPALAAMIGSFVLCQVPLHLQMVRYKQARIYDLDEMIRALQPTPAAPVDELGLHRLDYLGKERDRVIALPEWPFRWGALAGLSASSLGPLVPLLLKHGPEMLDTVLPHAHP